MNQGEMFKPHSEGIPRVEAVSSWQEVDRYFTFANTELGVDWGEEGIPEEYTAEYVATHPELTQIFVIRDKDKEILAGAKVKKMTSDDEKRLGLDDEAFVGRKGALLEYAVVREEHRKRGLLTLLTQQRIDWAKEHGIQYVCTEIELNGSVPAYTKIKDNFVFIGLREPGAGISEPYFVAVKSVAGNPFDFEKMSADGDFEKKEIKVDENAQDDLKKLFSDGWVGIDMKLGGEAGPWTLILGKKKEF